MELKTPTKKGIKTPRYRPPLPMLNESFSGYCVDEYDWPLFSGYYNGTSVIVDDSQAMTLLTNKGFFGKGSLSKGCPNVSKRKIPVSVVYESQWKRRKMWMQSLNNLLENRKTNNINLEDDVGQINNKEDDGKKMVVEAENTESLQNNSCKTDQKSSKTSEDDVNEKDQKKPDEVSKDIVDIGNKECYVVGENEIDVDKNTSQRHDSCKTQEEAPKTSGNEDGGSSQNKSNQTSQDNIVEKKSNDVEKMEVDNEKNSAQNNSCNIEGGPDKGSENEDAEGCNNRSVKTSKDNMIKSDEKMDVDSQKNNLFEIDEVKTGENEDNGNKKGLPDTGIDTKQNIEEQGQKDMSDSDKNEEIIKNPVDSSQSENDLKDNEKIDDNNGVVQDSTSSNVVQYQSKSVKQINLSNNTERGTLNINEVLVIPDINGELEQYFLNLKPYVEEEKIKTAFEVLYLSLEEAFFLSYACNCLQIFDLASNVLRIRDMWILFQESQPDFIEKYVAYHYFRAKGWVVKSGTKFGGDFLLYKKGPLYFHASYIVIVEVLKNGQNSRNKTTWQKIVGINRMAETANKEVLICHVLWPDVEEEKFNDPAILKEFGVSEILLRRWQATQEKAP